MTIYRTARAHEGCIIQSKKNRKRANLITPKLDIERRNEISGKRDNLFIPQYIKALYLRVAKCLITSTCLNKSFPTKFSAKQEENGHNFNGHNFMVSFCVE